MSKSRVSFVPEEQDREAIRIIRERQGLMYDASAIRFALRRIARMLNKSNDKEKERDEKDAKS